MSKDVWKKALKERIGEAIRRAPVNHAGAVNIGRGNSRTSISTRQTVTHRDGKTEVTEVREERRET